MAPFAVRDIPLECLRAAEWNANEVPPSTLKKIRASIEDFGVVENLVPTFPWGHTPWIGTKWTDVVAFVVLVLVLVVRPSGILGERLGRAA